MTRKIKLTKLELQLKEIFERDGRLDSLAMREKFGLTTKQYGSYVSRLRQSGVPIPYVNKRWDGKKAKIKDITDKVEIQERKSTKTKSVIIVTDDIKGALKNIFGE